MDAELEIRKFIKRETTLEEFKQLYEEKPEIDGFLQGIIDDYLQSGKSFLPVIHMCIRTKNMEYFRNPPSRPQDPEHPDPFRCTRNYLTEDNWPHTTNLGNPFGRWSFYERVYDIYYQHDQTLPMQDDDLSDEFFFAIDMLPNHLDGGTPQEYVITRILPQYPDTMPMSQRKKEIRARLKAEFPTEKGYPSWQQESGWPFGKDGRPAVYLGSRKKQNVVTYRFRDQSDGEEITVCQDWNEEKARCPLK